MSGDRYLTEWREALNFLERALGACDGDLVARARQGVTDAAAQVVLNLPADQWPPNVEAYL